MGKIIKRIKLDDPEISECIDTIIGTQESLPMIMALLGSEKRRLQELITAKHGNSPDGENWALNFYKQEIEIREPDPVPIEQTKTKVKKPTKPTEH